MQTDPYYSLSRLHKRNKRAEVHFPRAPTESTVAMTQKTYAGNPVRKPPSISPSFGSSILKDYLRQHAMDVDEGTATSTTTSSSTKAGTNMFGAHRSSSTPRRALSSETKQFSFLNAKTSSDAAALQSNGSTQPQAVKNPLLMPSLSRSLNEDIMIADCDISFGRLRVVNAKLAISRTSWQVQTAGLDRIPSFFLSERMIDRACILDSGSSKQIYVTLVRARVFKSTSYLSPIIANHVHYRFNDVSDPQVSKLISKLENGSRETVAEDELMMSRKVSRNCEPSVSISDFREGGVMEFEDVDRDSAEYRNIRAGSADAGAVPATASVGDTKPLTETEVLSDITPMMDQVDGRRKSQRLAQIAQYGDQKFDPEAVAREQRLKHLEQFGSGDLAYTFNDGRTQTISASDFERLEEGEFLNDTVVNFFLKYCHERLLKMLPEIGKTTHIFNTYFFERLSRDGVANFDEAYNQLKKWTSKVDLFSKQYIVIPVHQALHWYVIIIYNAPMLLHNEAGNGGSVDDEIDVDAPEGAVGRPRMFVFDSLKRGNTSMYGDSFRLIRLFIQHEAKAKFGKDLDVAHSLRTRLAHCPQQRNYCDCGVFLIHYVQKLLQQPEAFIRLMGSRAPRYRRPLHKLWLPTPTTLKAKRDDLRNLICSLKNDPEADRPYFMLPDDANSKPFEPPAEELTD